MTLEELRERRRELERSLVVELQAQLDVFTANTGQIPQGISFTFQPFRTDGGFEAVFVTDCSVDLGHI